MLPRTPQEAAEQVLAALEPTTTVTTDSDVTVADRDAYELVLDPNDDASLIGQVRLAIDGETKMPLRVQVFGGTPTGVRGRLRLGQLHPAGRPRVRVQPAARDQGDRGRAARAAGPPTEKDRSRRSEEAEEARSRPRSSAAAGAPWWHPDLGAPDGSEPSELDGFVGQLPRVSGAWGSGRLLAGTAFSAVLTDDGRLGRGGHARRSCTRRWVVSEAPVVTTG